MDEFRTLIVRHHIGKSEFINQYYRVQKEIEKAKDEKVEEDGEGDFAQEVENKIAELAPEEPKEESTKKNYLPFRKTQQTVRTYKKYG